MQLPNLTHEKALSVTDMGQPYAASPFSFTANLDRIRKAAMLEEAAESEGLSEQIFRIFTKAVKRFPIKHSFTYDVSKCVHFYFNSSTHTKMIRTTWRK